MHLRAKLTQGAFHLECRIQIQPGDQLQLTTDGADISITDGFGQPVPREAITAACLSAFRVGRNSFHRDLTQISLIEIKGSYPNGDLSQLANCIYEIIRSIAEQQGAVENFNLESESWKISVHVLGDTLPK